MAVNGGNKYDKCHRYWRGCFNCRYYLGTDHALFCAAYNIKKYGSPVVEIDVEQQEQRAWWSNKNGRRPNHSTAV